MRIIRITTNYSSYLEQFYLQRPDLKSEPYDRQYQTLMADCFGWADFWTHALQPLGYEVWEPVGNAEAMQKAWAQEHGVSYDKDTWLYEVLAAQIRSFQPEILFVDDYSTYTYDFLQAVRQQCSSIKLVVGWCGAPYQDASVFHAYDLVLSNIPELVTHFRKMGHRAEHLHHAFDPRILTRLAQSPEPCIDFSFIGSLFKGIHTQREQLLKTLVEQTPLTIFAHVYCPPLYKYVLQRSLYRIVQASRKFPGIESWLLAIPVIEKYSHLQEPPDMSQYIDHHIVRRAQSPVFGMRMFQTLHDSAVTLNNHIDISRHSASNMRLFEATGIGTCLLTDQQDNLGELFTPELEVITYYSSEDCLEKVRWLLNHPTARKTIAKSGQQRTLRDHTFAQRAMQLDEILRKSLKACS